MINLWPLARGQLGRVIDQIDNQKVLGEVDDSPLDSQKVLDTSDQQKLEK